MRKLIHVTLDNNSSLLGLTNDGTLFRLERQGWTQLDVPPIPQPAKQESMFEDVDPRADTQALEAVKFSAFWEAYGHKINRQNAEKAWAKLREAEKRAAMLALPEYVVRTTISGEPGKTFRAHAATWLNGKRWLDSYAKPASVAEDDEEVLQ